MSDERISEIREMAESYSGLQYVVTDPTKQWPWGSVLAVNEIVDLVRAVPELLAELAAAQARAEAVESAAITVLECIDDPLFLHADALKRSPHVKELRAVLAAAPEARDA